MKKNVALMMLLLMLVAGSAFAADSLNWKVYNVPYEGVTVEFYFHSGPFGPGEQGMVELNLDGQNLATLGYSFEKSCQCGFVANTYPFTVEGDKIEIVLQVLNGTEIIRQADE